jgi:cytochrome d ubiquinol oxidase subunit I
VFNPSFLYRLLHNVTAFYITTAFVVMGVGAWLLRLIRAIEDSRMMIRMALNLLIILVPLQIFLGDLHGLNTLKYQPAKIAAMEGLYDTAQPMPLTLFGIPDDTAAIMRYPVEIPNLGSLILTHSWDGAVKGLKEWPADERPPVALPFFAFRIMVGIGFIMLFVAIAGQILQLRGRLWGSVWFLRLCPWMAPLGFIAVIAGWIVTEVGRQPWTVYGLMRTVDSVSPSLTGTDVALSLAFYVVVYLIMFPTGLAFMAGLVRRGPQPQPASDWVESGLPRGPFENAARTTPGS